MIGMPTYGRSFTLINDTQFDIGAPASGGGKFLFPQVGLSIYDQEEEEIIKPWYLANLVGLVERGINSTSLNTIE